MNVLQLIHQRRQQGKKSFAVLIDPEKTSGEALLAVVRTIAEAHPQLILVGGSGYQQSLDDTVTLIQQHTDIPVVLFPGNASQFSPHANAMLFLSLISGRNPEFLIGQQVKAAPLIRAAQLETIPTGYILIDGGIRTAVERVSATTPLSDSDTIVATAQAGEMMGQQLIYLEAGSGALRPVAPDVIRAVRNNTSIPLIVGGGLTSIPMVQTALNAGADLIVVGNHFEKHPEDIVSFAALFA